MLKQFLRYSLLVQLLCATGFAFDKPMRSAIKDRLSQHQDRPILPQRFKEDILDVSPTPLIDIKSTDDNKFNFKPLKSNPELDVSNWIAERKSNIDRQQIRKDRREKRRANIKDLLTSKDTTRANMPLLEPDEVQTPNTPFFSDKVKKRLKIIDEPIYENDGIMKKLLGGFLKSKHKKD